MKYMQRVGYFIGFHANKIRQHSAAGRLHLRRRELSGLGEEIMNSIGEEGEERLGEKNLLFKEQALTFMNTYCGQSQ